MRRVNHWIVGFRFNDELFRTLSGFICLGTIVLSVVTSMVFSVNRVHVRQGLRVVSFYTFSPTVKEAIKEAGIRSPIGCGRDPDSLREGETVSFQTLSEEPNSPITRDINIVVYSNEISKIVKHKSIAPVVNQKWDIFLEPGKQKVLKLGKAGVQKDTFLVYKQNGKKANIRNISSTVLKQPGITFIASGSYKVASRQNNFLGVREDRYLATAYTYTGYRTAVGAKTRRGIVAVDPTVIPLGTRLFIQGYGYAVAADTGSAIKGKRLDVFLESAQAAKQWGKRQVRVYFLKK